MPRQEPGPVTAVLPDPPGARPADLQVLATWAPELAETFVALSSDIALVLDEAGTVRKMAQHAGRRVAPDDWLGRHWPAAVAVDSRAKAEDLLADAAACGRARRREINQLDNEGQAHALAYSAVRLGEHGPTLVVGHDLGAHVALQQRFVSAQLALERSYWQAQSAPEGTDGTAATPAGGMTQRERASLGLGAGAAPSREHEDAELLRALSRLYERIGQDALPDLMRGARRAAERHFLQRALDRAGSVEALARSLGMSPRALARRSGMPLRPSQRPRRTP